MATQTESTTKMVTGKVRLSFLHVWEPSSMSDNAPKKYSASIIIPKSDLVTKAKIDACVAAALDAGKASKFGGKVPPNIKMPLRDGDLERKDDPAYKNAWFIGATSTQQPGVLDENKNEMLNKAQLYSGCYGKVSVNFYAFNTNGNRGIACGLNNIMKVADGEALSGRARAEDDFANVEAGDDDDI